MSECQKPKVSIPVIPEEVIIQRNCTEFSYSSQFCKCSHFPSYQIQRLYAKVKAAVLQQTISQLATQVPLEHNSAEILKLYLSASASQEPVQWPPMQTLLHGWKAAYQHTVKMLPMNSVCFRTLKNTIAEIATYTTNHLGVATPKEYESTYTYRYTACHCITAHERQGQRTVIFYKCAERSNLFEPRDFVEQDQRIKTAILHIPNKSSSATQWYHNCIRGPVRKLLNSWSIRYFKIYYILWPNWQLQRGWDYITA